MMPSCVPERAPKENQDILDLTWSDPDASITGWNPQYNPQRGVGCYYGPDMVAAWLDKVDCPLFVRSHELRSDESFDEIECPDGKVPRYPPFRHLGLLHPNLLHGLVDRQKCCTVFSVSNYYEPGSNTGSVLKLKFEDGKVQCEPKSWMIEQADGGNSTNHQRNSAQVSELITMHKPRLLLEYNKMMEARGVEPDTAVKDNSSHDLNKSPNPNPYCLVAQNDLFISPADWVEIMKIGVPQLSEDTWSALQYVLAPGEDINEKASLSPVSDHPDTRT